MWIQQTDDALARPGSSEKRSTLRIAATIMSSLTLMVVLFVPARAGGATQISGIGFFAGPGECVDPVTGPGGASPNFATILTGDLEGCLYVFVETYECRPSGTYIETGTEVFVGSGGEGNAGTFRTTYRFSAKYADCTNLTGQIFGRCQHPIVASTGSDDFEGVTGRIDFKDDISAGNFPYTGHLSW